MSKALVLVASLYVFLAPICDKQERETNLKGSNEQGQGKRHHKQIELLAIAYVLLSSCFFFIHYFSYFLFSTYFCSYTFDIYFFPARSTQEQTTKNMSSIG